MADDEPEQGYTWETEYERTWEAIQEDEGGSLQASVEDIVHRAKRRKLAERPINVKLGMMRHLFIVLDMSAAMEDHDLKPSRFKCSLKILEHFIEELFDQNPIAQIGIITTKDKRADKLTELGGNPKRHIEALKKLKDTECKGEPSLENSLDLALQTLKHVPGHASREILIIFGSLTTCDPGNVMDTIKNLKASNVRCSVIGLAAEVHICKKLCQVLKGKYDIILEDNHFRDLLLQHVMPPPSTVQTEASLIRMGFPHHQLKGESEKEDKPSMCLCHLESSNKRGFSNRGYFCPQCKAKYCELPMECKACDAWFSGHQRTLNQVSECTNVSSWSEALLLEGVVQGTRIQKLYRGLMLVSAPHLARSYHHLFPLDAFTELQTDQLQPKLTCYSCQKLLTETTVYQCPRCSKVLCIDCDIFIHETLHSCPGCAASRATQQVEASFVS